MKLQLPTTCLAITLLSFVPPALTAEPEANCTLNVASGQWVTGWLKKE
jgi:hypothetical protein